MKRQLFLVQQIMICLLVLLSPANGVSWVFGVRRFLSGIQRPGRIHGLLADSTELRSRTLMATTS